jgi:hypothetical protein
MKTLNTRVFASLVGLLAMASVASAGPVGRDYARVAEVLQVQQVDALAPLQASVVGAAPTAAAIGRAPGCPAAYATVACRVAAQSPVHSVLARGAVRDAVVAVDAVLQDSATNSGDWQPGNANFAVDTAVAI